MPGILGRATIVTGAAGGIGLELTRSFLAGGSSVVMSDVNETALETSVNELRGQGAREVSALPGDLSQPGVADAVVAHCVETFGRVDILVANAGGGVVARTLDHTESTLQATIDRNLWTAIRSALAVLGPMRSAGYGRVVLMGADSVRNGLEGHAIYNAAKGGVVAMARGLAREFATDGITFNVVSPCATRTPELDRYLRDDPELAASFLRVIPAGRPAELSEVASAVIYLASEEAGFITGQVLSVNGGSTMV